MRMNFGFQSIGGATFVLTIGDMKIACDPVLCNKGIIVDFFWFKSKRIESPVYDETTFRDVDLWLITHNHEDHLDDTGLSVIGKHSTVVCNKNSSAKLAESGLTDLTVLDWGEWKNTIMKGCRIGIEAIPAVHGISPLSAFFAGKGNGYCLTITKGEEHIRIYITGDTVYRKRIIRAIGCRAIDLMIANMGAAKAGTWIMTLTLNAKMLQKMISALQPKIVIPVHYGTFEHYREPVEEIEKLQDPRIRLVKNLNES